jgi:hypothetical protein
MVNGDLSDLFTPQNVMNAIVLNALLPNGLTGPSSPGGSSSGNGGNSMSGGAPGISLDNEPVAGFMPFADQSSGPGASRDRKPTGARRRGGNTGAAGNTQYCCYWATAGECDKNPTWMKVNCQKACGTSSATGVHSVVDIQCVLCIVCTQLQFVIQLRQCWRTTGVLAAPLYRIQSPLLQPLQPLEIRPIVVNGQVRASATRTRTG